MSTKNSMTTAINNTEKAVEKAEALKVEQSMNKAVENTNKKVVYVASGDLSHKLQEYGPYGYAEEGSFYEKEIVETIKLIFEGRVREVIES